jgi:heat shock protein HslJ
MNTRNLRKLIMMIALLASLSFILGACSSPAPNPTPTPLPAATDTTEPEPTEDVAPTPEPTADLAPHLVDAMWLLVAFGEATNPTVVEEGTVVTALFSSDGMLSGSGGCNNYTTSYELAGDQLTVADPIASTMMFCETGMDQESTFLAALQSAGRIVFTSEDRLEIFYDLGSSTERKMVFVPGETPLVDTVWVLENMGNPNNPTSVEEGMIITAIFSQEGNLSGTSGCNNYVASYTLQDNQIEIQQAVSTLRACTQGMEQEAAYLKALESAETYQIEGARLKITYDEGDGVLVYTSRSLPLEHTLWTLVTMNGERNTTDQVATTILFDPGPEPGQGSVGGMAMCNAYRGGYTAEEDKLTVSELSSTKINCPETVMQAEETYLELLGTAQTYQVFGQTLIITSEKGLLTYIANRAPLEGTNWRLTALGPVDNPIAPVEGADFTAQFVRQPGIPSGLILGGTGCNEYNAVYAANLNEIKVNIPSRTTNPGCASGLPVQEMQYYLALNAASSYRILGDNLQIFYGDGEMLNYTAFVPQAPPSGGPLTGLNGTSWWLVSMRNIVLRPGTTITADFAINPDGETGTINGSGGCNNYTATILGYFQVEPAAATMMTCTEPVGVMEQESSYLAMLTTADRISQVNNQLVIGTHDGLLVYYNQPVPILPIEPPATETPEPPATVTPEAPTATPEQPTPEPTTATPEPTQEPVEPMPPIATLPAEIPPVAVIYAPTEGVAGDVIIFDASDSTPEGWLGGYTWNFGDGTISEGVLVEHVFVAPGVYTVTLTVVDFNGQTSEDTVTITIQ